MSKVTDNVHLDFPAKMADGRSFTDYRANCIMNREISQTKNSFDYRYFLETNGTTIEQNTLSTLDDKLKCNECKYDTVLPVQTVQNCNAGVCSVKMNDPNGVGLDRGNTYQQ